MGREDQIKALLHRLAPVLRDVCETAQAQAAGLPGTDWAQDCIYRGALLNRLVGTARWGLAADGLVERRGELEREGLTCTSSYEEQNQGRFYWSAPQLGLILTVRREAHKDPKGVTVLQMRMEEVLQVATGSFPSGAVVAYLAVPPAGQMSRVELTTERGVLLASYTIQELLAAPVQPVQDLPQREARPRRRIASTLNPEREQGSEEGPSVSPS